MMVSHNYYSGDCEVAVRHLAVRNGAFQRALSQRGGSNSGSFSFKRHPVHANSDHDDSRAYCTLYGSVLRPGMLQGLHDAIISSRLIACTSAAHALVTSPGPIVFFDHAEMVDTTRSSTKWPRIPEGQNWRQLQLKLTPARDRDSEPSDGAWTGPPVSLRVAL